MLTKTAAVLAVAFLGIGLGHASAQMVPCSRLLTAAEVAQAAGPGFKDLGHETTAPGESVCMWLLESGANPKAIQFTLHQPSGTPSVPALFESDALKAEKLHGTKREVLDGIGARAVLIAGMKPGAMHVLVIQTATAVAYVETDYLERPQLLRLAKAIAAP